MVSQAPADFSLRGVILINKGFPPRERQFLRIIGNGNRKGPRIYFYTL